MRQIGLAFPCRGRGYVRFLQQMRFSGMEEVPCTVGEPCHECQSADSPSRTLFSSPPVPIPTSWPVAPHTGFISASQSPNRVMSSSGSFTRSHTMPGIAPKRRIICLENFFWLSTKPGQATSLRVTPPTLGVAHLGRREGEDGWAENDAQRVEDHHMGFDGADGVRKSPDRVRTGRRPREAPCHTLAPA